MADDTVAGDTLTALFHHFVRKDRVLVRMVSG
jgi:cytochrome b561